MRALRKEIERSIEGKLILSSNVKGWNISENIIAEKAVNETEPWEFGYALAAAHPLALTGAAGRCIFCRQNFTAGAELFGGLGTADYLRSQTDRAIPGADGGFQCSARSDVQVFSGVWIERQLRGRAVAIWRFVRNSTVSRLVQEDEMKGRMLLLIGCLVMCPTGVLWPRQTAHGSRKCRRLIVTRTNPYAGNRDAVAAGRNLFANNCAKCHGEECRRQGSSGRA